jgi:two-component system cell cycle sensor histidine kinase PleC
VDVADTGIGIAAKDVPTALERFGQVDRELARKHEGTGLGLPLSKRLMELHGGTLELQSAPGVGTTVTITFPAQRVIASRQAA